MSEKVQSQLQECLTGLKDLELPESTFAERESSSSKSDDEPIDNLQGVLSVLKSSNMELRRLTGSKLPEIPYRRDFAFSEKTASGFGGVIRREALVDGTA